MAANSLPHLDLRKSTLMPRALRLFALAGLLTMSGPVPLVLADAADPPALPAAPLKPVTDTYFGQTVTDPYRWMEDLSAPEVKTWFQGQNDYTRNALAKIPGRDALDKRLLALDSVTTSVSSIQWDQGRYFYEKERPHDDQPKLYVRQGLTGPERLLVDPDKMLQNGVHSALDYYAASPDGSRVLYAVSPGGSENSTIHILDVATGKTLDAPIDRTRFGGPSWLPDGRSFFYSRLPKTPDGQPTELQSVVYRHRLGTSPDEDKPVFGYNVSPKAAVAPSDISFVGAALASPYALGVVEHGVRNEVTIYVAPLASVTGAQAPWRKIVDVDDDITGYDLRGAYIYLVTHKNAARFKVIRMRLDKLDVAQAVTVIPASRAVVQSIAVAKDALYAQTLDGGIGHLLRVPFGKDGVASGSGVSVPLPFKGTIASYVTDPRRPGALVGLTGWTKSLRYENFNPATNTVTQTALKPISPVNFSGVTSVEVTAKAADGTLIPLSIIFAKNMRRDGTHPTLLTGYGAYGIVQSPGFNPALLAWLEHGGVYAVAHVRGGGEYGDDWHRAGYKATKPNTWRDLIACGQYLVAQHYTRPKLLACEGGSAGGITVGRAITERPDLWGACLDDVGVSNPVRQEFSPNGPANIPEFGSVTTEQGFHDLYAMDSYLHIKDGVRYPAVLLTTGINDPRVASWEPAKMTARLQAAEATLPEANRRPILLRVDYDAGHGIGSTKAQYIAELADEWSFLLWQFGQPGFQPQP